MQLTIQTISYCRLNARADRIFRGALYLIAYPLILAVLVRSILSYMSSREASDLEAEQIQLMDRRVMIILGGIFVVGCSVITILR